MLPKLAKKRVDELIAEAQDAQYKLEILPTTTTEFVEALTFLDKIQDRVRETRVVVSEQGTGRDLKLQHSHIFDSVLALCWRSSFFCQYLCLGHQFAWFEVCN